MAHPWLLSVASLFLASFFSAPPAYRGGYMYPQGIQTADQSQDPPHSSQRTDDSEPTIFVVTKGSSKKLRQNSGARWFFLLGPFFDFDEAFVAQP